MHKYTLILLLVASVTAKIQAQNTKTREYIAQYADKINDKVIAWRRDIHQNPELGNREFRTAALIANHLKQLGIEVQTGVAKTGVVGILNGAKPGPVIALRADMDGLPIVERVNITYASTVKTTYNGQEVGVMHACGHDTHVAILMGVAEILASMKNELSGTVKFLFQPAEEGAPKGEEGGAELMVKEGVLEAPHVDVAFGLHISANLEVGKIGYRPEGTMASINDMRITVKGVSSHGAYPWSSADPIVTAAQIVNNLQTIVSRNVNLTENAAVVTIGAIKGGNRSNIIPEEVEMLGTIRALSRQDEVMIMRRVREIVDHTAKGNGCTAKVELPYSSSYPVTYNDPKLTEEVLPSLKATVGEENVELQPAHTGAEDFSFFGQKVPAFFYFLGGMPKGADPLKASPHHTPDFFVDDASLVYGINAMCNLVVDYADLQNNTSKKPKKKSI
jgi:amidohydrolase